ncbi:hypothetical protein [Lactiplantibacillus plantarum]|uniref:hypothetical protein n=1 Tax=Lactiplantibacillus plantarum TaxID=1590 RepID=UPI001017E3CC|nr:hypothetical protein [Lactiplantibacillus plantarum]QBA80726.1 hypothetical protein EVF25_09655 [Lactiplantibacillus plantarum]
MKENKVPKTHQELRDNFNDHLSDLIIAANQYDAGNRRRIKIASPILRTLFYKQRYGEIMIKILPPEVSIDFESFASSVSIADNSILYGGPVRTGQIPDSNFKNPKKIYLPLFNKEAIHWIDFEDWWQGRILYVNGESFKRWELVKYMANQDGGAHEDLSLGEKYSKLKHNLFSIEDANGGHYKELNLALLRQAVHETLLSFNKMNLLPEPYTFSEYDVNFSTNNATFSISQMNLSEGENQTFKYY